LFVACILPAPTLWKVGAGKPPEQKSWWYLYITSGGFATALGAAEHLLYPKTKKVLGSPCKQATHINYLTTYLT